MLRLIPRSGHRNIASCARKNETIAELKNEAKRRGLSSKAYNATLVLRLEDYEKGADFGRRSTGIRRASNSATAPQFDTEVPGNPDLPSIASTSFLNLKLPDLSVPPHPVPPGQVPYVPDFWNSAPPRTDVPKDEQLPKLLVVAGAETHPAGGPSHNLLDNGITSEKPEVAPQQNSHTLLDDISEDLGLPPVNELSARLRKIFS
ncbi:hypothetical protein M413DRAFT_438238 [Hebeloma cylindrosporum]|uniref:SAP domain-containing protein n=1 Tax=Hebeloma cylindrosporum TaxID=76867 RepID=A0A0C2YHA6_HEBCY|nr:hypothetical protein M413DRAFT_438238 [Hebeloma cylindrosporum h7]